MISILCYCTYIWRCELIWVFWMILMVFSMYWAKTYIDSSVYVARSLLPDEAKRTRYWAGTARHHRFTDDCAWDPGLHVVCNAHSLQFREFLQNLAVHILHIHFMLIKWYYIWTNILSMHDYRHIRNTFFGHIPYKRYCKRYTGIERNL